jgi:hypothetical protein
LTDSPPRYKHNADHDACVAAHTQRLPPAPLHDRTFAQGMP